MRTNGAPVQIELTQLEGSLSEDAEQESDSTGVDIHVNVPPAAGLQVCCSAGAHQGQNFFTAAGQLRCEYQSGVGPMAFGP